MVLAVVLVNTSTISENPILLVLLGTLTAGETQILGYFFGSSAGSKNSADRLCHARAAESSRSQPVTSGRGCDQDRHRRSQEVVGRKSWDPTSVAVIAVIISSVGLLSIMVGVKLFGGGNRLATMFAKLDKDTTTAISALRADADRSYRYLRGQLPRRRSMSMRANIQAMQVGLSSSARRWPRTTCRRRPWRRREIESDMKDGFTRREQRLERIERPNGKPVPPQ